MSGLTEELIEAAITDHDENAVALCAIITDIRNNRVHPLAADAIRRCKLINAGKPVDSAGEQGIRPIAIGEVLLKIAAAMSIGEVFHEASSILEAAGQLGLAMAGCERVCHDVREAIDKDPTLAVVTIDATNAFNEQCRIWMAYQLYSHACLSPLFNIFDLAYSKAGDLVLKIQGVEHIIKSSTGTRQGDVLGSLLFCLGMNPLLLRAKARHNDVGLRAIIDDITIWGPPASVLDCFEYLRAEMMKISLRANYKTTMYAPAGYIHDETRFPTSGPDRAITLSYDGVKIVGSMQSRDPSIITSFLEEKQRRGEDLFRRITQLPPNQAFVILQKCTIPRVMYISRTMNPDYVIPSLCEPFDARVRDALQVILQCSLSQVSYESEILMHLPPSEGGAGITQTSLIARDAFLASLMNARGTNPTANQHTLVKARNRTLAAFVDSLGPTEKGHRLACSQRNSFAAFGVPHVGFPADHFSAALRWRLAIPDSDVRHPLSVCPGCCRQYTAREYHEHKVGCARLPSVNAYSVHNFVNKNGIQTLCARAGLSYKHEPRHYENYVPPKSSDHDDPDEGGKGHREGPDLVIYFPQPQTIDFKGTNGASKYYLKQRYAAIEGRKERESRALYESHCLAKGEIFNVLHFHSGGRFDDNFVSMVRRICDVRPLRLDYRAELARISVALQTAIGQLLLVHGRPTICNSDGECVVAPRRPHREKTIVPPLVPSVTVVTKEPAHLSDNSTVVFEEPWPFGSSSCGDLVSPGAVPLGSLNKNDMSRPLGGASCGSLVGSGSVLNTPSLNSPNYVADYGSAICALSASSLYASQPGSRDHFSARRSRHPWLPDRLLPLDITLDPSPAPLVGQRAPSVTQAAPFVTSKASTSEQLEASTEAS